MVKCGLWSVDCVVMLVGGVTWSVSGDQCSAVAREERDQFS